MTQSKNRTPTFTSPSKVLTFVRECLQMDDPERLFRAVLEPTPEFWQQLIFDDLSEIDATDSLEIVFLANDGFPDTQGEFKMGGHSNRTRHLNLDLIFLNDAWRLKSIWKCR